MPELPEVETLRRQLTDAVVGKTISGVEIIDAIIPPFTVNGTPLVIEIRRWGKYLGICLNNGQQIIIHLRMTGNLLLLPADETLPAHSRFVILFNEVKVVCRDPRRFATIDLVTSFTKNALIENPAVSFPTVAIAHKGASASSPIKQFLLRQEIVAGIGNIYACEILFVARISPFKKTSELTRGEWLRISKASAKILAIGIESRGVSVSDWRDLFGEKGKYQEKLLVYKRKGEKCHRCSGIIERKALAGRGTFFCPSCQR
ncbi:MAG: bifunctional DNA-formamidopyrimidine glycosylase/DNA-(apurinic or apyrimidinic site) lyase [Desulfocapsa sp.]|nr:bifunctional DNA-formamidopyrimidine glycosylase/DNA-(apurinic or apyrimidinic site) lyase [Desulfocapsa sp.]